EELKLTSHAELAERAEIRGRCELCACCMRSSSSSRRRRSAPRQPTRRRGCCRNTSASTRRTRPATHGRRRISWRASSREGAFLRLKRERVPLNRDVILLVEPDEEVGGTMGARWMIANHYAELDPEYVVDEGGFGSRDLFSPGKLVYGIAVAEKKLVWLKVRA